LIDYVLLFIVKAVADLVLSYFFVVFVIVVVVVVFVAAIGFFRLARFIEVSLEIVFVE
jgi:hypothetical protein